MEQFNTSLEGELRQMYARTEHWISDYAFFEDEIRFLTNLLDRYFIGVVIADSPKLELLRSKTFQLQDLDKERASIADDNKQTLAYIARLLKNETVFDPQDFREEYADIENEQVGFMKRYRAIKKEIFDLSAQLQNSGTNKAITTN